MNTEGSTGTWLELGRIEPSVNLVRGAGRTKKFMIENTIKLSSKTDDMTLAAFWKPPESAVSTPPSASTSHPPKMGAIMFPRAKQMLNSAAALSATAVKFLGDVV